MKKRNVFLTLFIFLVIWSLIGCRTYKTIEVPKITTITKYKYIHDSIHSLDSVYVPYFYDKHDSTPLSEKEQAKIPVKREVHIVYKERQDSAQQDSVKIIYKIKEVPVEVEKDLNWIQKTLMYVGAATIIVLVFLLVFKNKSKIIKLITKYIK